MSSRLKQFFSENFAISQEEIKDIVSYFSLIKTTKDQILVNCGDTCRYFYFIEKGGVKACFINSGGQETIRHVSFENQFISSIHSFIEQSPSNEYLSTIEPSHLWAISNSDFKLALNKYSSFKDFYIQLLEKTYTYNHWRLETFLRLDAKQRYEYLLKNKKQLVWRLSNKNLAAYMGITQESLSRIKAKR